MNSINPHECVCYLLPQAELERVHQEAAEQLSRAQGAAAERATAAEAAAAHVVSQLTQQVAVAEVGLPPLVCVTISHTQHTRQMLVT